MKFHVRVDGRSYEVEVEPADMPGLASAASRVEGSKMSPSRSAGVGTPARASTPLSPDPAGSVEPAPSIAATRGTVSPSTPKTPIVVWHGVTLGAPGECVAPAAGLITGIRVKVGDAVRPGDALVDFEFARSLATSERPVFGTVRASDSGLVADVHVCLGQVVSFGDPLVKVRHQGTPA